MSPVHLAQIRHARSYTWAGHKIGIEMELSKRLANFQKRNGRPERARTADLYRVNNEVKLVNSNRCGTKSSFDWTLDWTPIFDLRGKALWESYFHKQV
jgi:hypothetical protein